MFRFPSALEKALQDRTFGSSVLVETVALYLAALPGEMSQPQFVQTALALLTRRPHFALLFHLLHSTGQDCFGGAGSPHPCAGVQRASALWLSRWQKARREIRSAPVGAGEAARVLTWSHSGTLALYLQRWQRESAGLEVYCARSLPGGEGARMAEALANAGVHSRIVEDRETDDTLKVITRVMVGADALHRDHFWNKVGTGRLLWSARAAGVPTLVIAEGAKWCHPAWGASLASASPVAEVDQLFEVIDNQSVTLFVTEAGQAAPGELSGLLLPPPYYPPLGLHPQGRPYY